MLITNTPRDLNDYTNVIISLNFVTRKVAILISPPWCIRTVRFVVNIFGTSRVIEISVVRGIKVLTYIG